MQPKRKGLPRRNWILAGSAALIALVIGIGVGYVGSDLAAPPPTPSAPSPTATPLDAITNTAQVPASAADTCADQPIFSVQGFEYGTAPGTINPSPLGFEDEDTESGAPERDDSLPPLPTYEPTYELDGWDGAMDEAMEAAAMSDEPMTAMPMGGAGGGGGDMTAASGAPALGDSASDSAEAPIVPTSVASMRAETTSDEPAPPIMPSAAVADADTLAQRAVAPLRAGEIDDNAAWDIYQTYRRNFFAMYGAIDVHDVDVDGRQVIRVTDSAGLPVLGACVEIYQNDLRIAQARTYATGQTLFFPHAYDDTVRYNDQFRVVVSKGAATAEAMLNREAVGGVTHLTLAVDDPRMPQLDVLFLLDATGSMSDEIRQLQDNILAISAQIAALPNEIDTRYGLVAYRDRGDEYVTQLHDFTDDVSAFQMALNSVVANGGGDTPESLNQAFYEGLTALNWREGETVKLVFLVADAPPHLDYPDDVSYAETMRYALARGIKVHPIASGGLDNQGEFILRQIAQHTMGKFIFLTYESGTGGAAGDVRTDLDVGDPEDEQGAGDYSVSQLDDLVLRLITDELAALRGE